MNVDDLKSHYGTQRAAAEALGTTPQVISAWKKAGRIPRGWQFEIQYRTFGKLQADEAQAVSRRKRLTKISASAY